MIRFDGVRKEEYLTIHAIARRAVTMAVRFGVDYPIMDADMDLMAAHTVCPLKLEQLLAADDANFSHDVFGIRRHLNRETGAIEDCFLPRFAK